MKRWVLGICFLLACVLCGFEVYASSSPYIDTCDSVSGDAVKTYSGFGAQISNFSDFSGWSACPDQTVLPMREQAQQASAIYQVRGSETVHVSVYVKNGSFAMPTSYGGKYGAYILGESERGALSDAIRCHYDAVQDRIFLVDGGKAYLLRAAPIGLYFSETDQEGLHLPNPFYGVNIAYSPDGNNFFDLSQVRLTSYRKQANGFYYHETYTAEIPAGASYVRIQLQKHRAVPGFDMPDAPVEQNLFLLSEVAFYGQSLEVGPEMPAPPSSSEDEPSGSEPSSSKDDAASSEPPPVSSEGPSSSSETSTPEEPPSSSEPSNPEKPPSSEPSIPEEPPSSSEPSVPENPPSSSEGPSIPDSPSSSEPGDISSGPSEQPNPSSSEPQQSAEEPILGPDPERRPRPHRRRSRNTEESEDESPLIMWGSTDNNLPPAPVIMMQQPQVQPPISAQEQDQTEPQDGESTQPISSSPQVIVRTMGSQVDTDRKKELPAVSTGAAAAGMAAMFLLGKRWKSSQK